MNKLLYAVLICFTLIVTGCDGENETQVLNVATSAEYPPFEYSDQGEIKGFDIDLARLVAKELGKKAVFHDMQFSSILPAVLSGQADFAISTITITKERKKNLDFSTPYYFEGMAAVFKTGQSMNSLSVLHDKKIACQLGTTMEIWAKKQVPSAELVLMDNNNQAVEALKAGHVDVVIMDGAQAPIFSKNNPGLAYVLIAQSEDGYALALPKNSLLTPEVNQALKNLEAKGEIQKLKTKWLENDAWNK
ncbi:ABC transporter substrate-binding protein [Legionella bononiensis]|uniref:Amino acid ABC transporter substrate-binding protein n=1 Tax=Legionella bononiensis TaxID=2793102 RepID=A0ABS1WDS1_9GAMM|nr:ABC transporter substrate-binding protein [Legionella bononiensis]MBL7481460.1 amino acid ABC transporter substrate-binding protein [Legionella bononiensis]MBL7527492.1 amino acid ABC transporter substrate-binding protein [Legionella bononiensis]